MRREKSTEIRIGTKPYRIVSDDDYPGAMDGCYEPQMVRLFDCLLSPEDCVLDVGANIGCTSILLGELSRQVVSFEPSPSTFAFLRRNIDASGLGNVALRDYALGSEASEAEITFNPNNRSGGFVSDRTKASSGHTTEAISIKRLDDVFDSLPLPRVDFIKIDVEGFEKYVIEGAGRTIEAFHPVIVLEMNHWCLNAFQRICVPDFLDFLRQRFPILLAVEGNHYADLHETGESYIVMYHHIIHFKYMNLVAAFDPARLAGFYATYLHRTL